MGRIFLVKLIVQALLRDDHVLLYAYGRLVLCCLMISHLEYGFATGEVTYLGHGAHTIRCKLSTLDGDTESEFFSTRSPL